MIDYLKIFSDILSEQSDHSKWVNSKHEKIKQISNSKVGIVGENFIQKFLKINEVEFEIPGNNNSPWDIKIKNKTFEIKAATEDTNGSFQFNHVRYHRNYDALICLGISPDDLFFDMWTASDVKTGKAGSLVTMEKGANASFKLTKKKAKLLSINKFINKVDEIIMSL